MSVEKDYVKNALEIFRDYHDTKISSSIFLQKHFLDTDSLDNGFLRSKAETALEVLKKL